MTSISFINSGINFTSTTATSSQTQANSALETEDLSEEENATKTQTARERFQELMDMSIEERYFELYLKQEGMTQEEFDALPPEEQQEIVQQFKEEMLEKMEAQTGSTYSIMA